MTIDHCECGSWPGGPCLRCPRENAGLVKAADAGAPAVGDQTVRDLVGIVLRFHSHTRHSDRRATIVFREEAIGYLKRKGLMPSPLRKDEQIVASDAADAGPSKPHMTTDPRVEAAALALCGVAGVTHPDDLAKRMPFERIAARAALAAADAAAPAVQPTDEDIQTYQRILSETMERIKSTETTGDETTRAGLILTPAYGEIHRLRAAIERLTAERDRLREALDRAREGQLP